ncbi:histidine kinase dimerization/phospho-acceptor domain-containing protein [Domibacillus sp.]|uniref:histidine kinase dimerization/phospho-acceptor domain-containing protein n=1 Tax=Domibacillus sp. TaxID=1969783 RepID=UPI002811B164|nr:histidine kinase dimerization/phospho-acceptor domain-containing protein [Domibacillus sp.]
MTVSMWVIFYILNIVFILTAAVLLEVIKTNFDVLQKLMKAKKLEIVSNLAASISHEVRNPLTASRGFMQLTYESDIPSETKEQILISIQELDTATGIINDYLTFAKPAPAEAEAIILHETINHAVNVLMPLANMNSIELDVSVEKKSTVIFLANEKSSSRL